MILKYALFRAYKLLASVTKQFTVSKTQIFSGKLLDSIDKCFLDLMYLFAIFSFSRFQYTLPRD